MSTWTRLVVCTALITCQGMARTKPHLVCSDSALDGSYGFEISGKHIAIGDYAIMGRFESDGRGKISGAGWQTINGNQGEVSFTGTYHVNTDCTGTVEVVFADKQHGELTFVLVSNGSEAFLFDVGGHTIETGEAKKQRDTLH